MNGFERIKNIFVRCHPFYPFNPRSFFENLSKNHMRRWPFLFLFLLLSAGMLRTVRLAQRPMHTDEAVHAVKFGSLLEENRYIYDPYEYHGPTLNYLTLPIAWLCGEHRFAQITERTLRLTPAIFGILLLLAFLPIRRELGHPTILMAALFTAISPAMVFYSRYYIQEMLLVCFTFAALATGWRALRSGRRSWAVLTGVFLGLMHATKETAVLAMAAAVVALLICLGRDRQRFMPVFQQISWPTIGLGLSVAVVTSALFYSSFGTNPHGVLDSFLTLKTYVDRAAGEHQTHLHPWYYYLGITCWHHTAGQPVWSEAGILLLSGYALLRLVRRKNQHAPFLQFMGWYAVLLLMIYSALPYKTPWSMLGFYQPLILLAGFAVVDIRQSIKQRGIRFGFIAAMIVLSAHLFWQTVQLNFKYECDPANPYVYGHTGKDVLKMVHLIRQVAEVHPDKKNLYLEVIVSQDDYWPLPWYLRDFSHVGYWNHVDATTPVAEIIIASPDQEQAVLTKVYETPPPGQRNLYVPLFDDYVELRPGVELRGYVTKELWDRFWQAH
jgi:uncharacterized protein (TIGR03663 family)